jgi:hypothetical protein
MMKQFASIEKIDTGILYALEFTSSISVLLLAFGLIASMANVLTKGAVLTDNLFMQRVWAWTQCIAIDANVAGTIIRTYRSYMQKEHIKCVLYAFLSALLLFTAAIVSNIESVQQTLNLSLEASYVHVFIPVEALIWVRSIAIVLLIVAHALRHVQPEPGHTEIAQPDTPTSLVLTPEFVNALRAALVQVTITEEHRQALPAPQGEQRANAQEAVTDEYTEQRASKNEQEANTAQEAGAAGYTEQEVSQSEQEKNSAEHDAEQETNNYERVKAYLSDHPDAKDREIADALTISSSTANKWRRRIKDEEPERK